MVHIGRVEEPEQRLASTDLCSEHICRNALPGIPILGGADGLRLTGSVEVVCAGWVE